MSIYQSCRSPQTVNLWGCSLLACLGAIPHLPAGAQSSLPVVEHVHGDSIIPAETVIAVRLSTPIKFVPDKQGNSLPITGFLMIPVYDQRGKLLAPKEALVTLWLEPHEDFASLVADGIVVGSRLIPIRTSELAIPAQRDEFLFDSEFVPNPGRINQVSTNLLGTVIQSDGLAPPVRAGLGLGLAVISGISSPQAKRSPKIVNIEGETVHVLIVSADANLPEDINPNPASSESDLEEE